MASADNDGHDLVRMKRVPARRDSTKTREAILASTARLLEDVGFERLSTNMICDHAGITPPALYRYFPNKYAVLFDLAHNLLVAQRAALSEWLAEDGFGWRTRDLGLSRLERLQAQMRKVADARVGTVWIIRAMRAIPKLREVRGVAQNMMLDDLIAGLRNTHPDLSEADLVIPARLVNEIVSMGTELGMDDPSLDTARLSHGISLAVVAYLEAVVQDVDKARKRS